MICSGAMCCTVCAAMNYVCARGYDCLWLFNFASNVNYKTSEIFLIYFRFNFIFGQIVSRENYSHTEKIEP